MNGVVGCGIALHGMARHVVAWHGRHDVSWYGAGLHCTGCMAFLCMSWCSMAWFGCTDCTYTLLLRFTFWGASSKSDNLVSSPEENH